MSLEILRGGGPRFLNKIFKRKDVAKLECLGFKSKNPLWCITDSGSERVKIVGDFTDCLFYLSIFV